MVRWRDDIWKQANKFGIKQQQDQARQLHNGDTLILFGFNLSHVRLITPHNSKILLHVFFKLPEHFFRKSRKTSALIYLQTLVLQSLS